jgi:cell division protein FtsL
MRFIHLLVICALVIGVSYVYRFKMESTARTERVQRLHAEVRKQREAIAALRAEWARLDSPRRLQGLAERHLKLKPLDARQYDQLKNLPERSPTLINPNAPDPIGAMIDTTDQEILTGSIPKPEGRQ